MPAGSKITVKMIMERQSSIIEQRKKKNYINQNKE